MRFFVLAAALCAFALSGPARAENDATATDGDPVSVQFRDLFRSGKPSPRAMELNGQKVLIQGFFADRPADDSPFYVLVGAPTQYCPYCSTVNEQDHLPFVLVYPHAEVPGHGGRTRVAVEGVLDAGLNYESTFGLHNDLRLLEAQVRIDARARRAQPPTATPPASTRQRPGGQEYLRTIEQIMEEEG